jgi:hypothetical protein
MRAWLRVTWWLSVFAVLWTIAPSPIEIPKPQMRWEQYGHASEIDYFAWWCAKNIIQSTEPFTGQPLILEPWQLEFMGEALAVDVNLSKVWKSIALIVSRKNGKTALLAAYALYHLLETDGNPEVLLAAASDKNARRLFDAVVLYIRANPALEAQVHIRDYIGEITRRDGLGTIYRLANDPTNLHGYNPSLVIVDELHAWTKPSHRLVWTALTTAGGARGNPQVFTITTAGEASQRKTSILGKMLTQNEERGELEKMPGLTISRNRDGETLFYNYCAPTAEHTDLEALKLANPSSWITVDGYLKRQSANPELTPAEVLQFHGCVWAAGETTWIDPDVFANLAADRGPMPDATECVLAFDGSYNRDSTALVGATIEANPYVWVERVWERPPNEPDWRTPRNEVMAAIEDAMGRYDVREFAPDPPGWHREIEELEAEYGEVVVRFETSQPRRMGPAADDFKQAVLGPGVTDAEALDEDFVPEPFTPEISHDGSEVLIRHLSNCVPVIRAGFTVPTKESLDSPHKIDAALSAVIAYHRAKWLYTNQQDDLVVMVVDTAPSRPSGRSSAP